MNTIDPIRQRNAMTRRLERRIACEGKINLPAVPGMLDDYVSRCEQVFEALGRKLNDAERGQLIAILAEQLQAAFARSQRSSITITYQATVGGLLNYVVAPHHPTVEQVYEDWVTSRQPPYFGANPDAKAMAVADLTGKHRSIKVLDIGAGTGRNALALARLGHRVDAIELTPKFAEILAETAHRESLQVRVICRDVFQASVEIDRDYQMMLASEVVSDFRSPTQFRDLLNLASRHLAHDGRLLVNAFIAKDHYSEDDAVRQFASQVYCHFLTPAELSAAGQGLPLALESDEGAREFEKTNLPANAWPPTSWYKEWSAGTDVFDLPDERCPIGLRWLVYRRTGPGGES
jgi:protein-L-isoaspartate O-methyltransferase